MTLTLTLYCSNVLIRGGVYAKREQLCPGRGKTVRLTDQKHNILDVMTAEIYKHKAYPSTKQIGLATEALVSKHACLKENGSKKGYKSWQNSLRFKMGNYRTKLFFLAVCPSMFFLSRCEGHRAEDERQTNCF